MNKEKLIEYVNLGYSTYKISELTGRSQTNVRLWLKKFELKTKPANRKKGNTPSIFDEGGIKYKICPHCSEKKELNNTNFYISKSGAIHSWCKKCNDKASWDKQKELKIKCIELKGGKCVICGYKKYVGAMDFHHIDPSKKEYLISELRTYSFEKIQIELAKCVVLCKNCHAEVHAGLAELSKIESPVRDLNP